MPRGNLPGTGPARQALHAALTGRRGGDVTGTGGVRDQLVAAFGTSKRDAARPDTAAAAKGLGVSQRTVQRWLSGAIRTPSPVHAKAIAKKAKQAVTTKSGRARTADQVRTRHPRGARLSIRGTIGVVSGARDNSRWRQINLDLSPGQLDGAMTAYEAGGDKAVVEWLETNADQLYVDGLYVKDVGEFGLTDPYGT